MKMAELGFDEVRVQKRWLKSAKKGQQSAAIRWGCDRRAFSDPLRCILNILNDEDDLVEQLALMSVRSSYKKRN